MSCDEVQGRLLDYLDGELSSAQAARVHEHLGRCLECRRREVAWRDLMQEAASLRTPEEPVGDLWPGIEQQLKSRSVAGGASSSWGWRSRLLATAAVLAVVVGSMLWRSPSTRVEVSSRPDILLEDELALMARVSRARHDSGVGRLHNDLLGALEYRRDELEPETLSAIEASIRDLDQAIGGIRLALDANPQDRRLHHLMATLHRQEAEFLRLIARS